MTTLRLAIPNSTTLRYKVLNGVLAAKFLLMAVASIVLAAKYLGYFRAHYVLWGLAGAAFLVFCIGYMLVFADEAFLKEKGQLFLTESGISINEEELLLGMLRKVVVAVKGYRGQVKHNGRTANGNGNRLVLHTVARQKIPCDFLLKSKHELELLETLLASWKASGVKIKINGTKLV